MLHAVKSIAVQCLDGSTDSVSLPILLTRSARAPRSLQLNSFEQLCINFANEQLQSYFNDFIFKLELLEYKHEVRFAIGVFFVYCIRSCSAR